MTTIDLSGFNVASFLKQANGDETDVKGKSEKYYNGFGAASSKLNISERLDLFVAKKEQSLGITEIQKSIKNDEKKVVELFKLSQKIDNVKNTLNDLRGTEPSRSLSQNLMQSKKAIITSNIEESGTSFIEVSANSSASLGGYDFEVTAIARTRIARFTDFASKTADATNPVGDFTPGKFTPGTFRINGTNIVVDPGDSLEDIAATINTKKSTTNVEALILPNNGTFRLILQSTLPGVANSFTVSDPDNVLNTMLTNVQAAQDASVRLNGITFTRPSNLITDLLEGVSIKILRTTSIQIPNGSGGLVSVPNTLRLNIESDKDAAIAGVKKFIEAYNDYMKFAKDQNRIDPKTGQYTEESILKNMTFMTNLTSNLTIKAGSTGFLESNQFDFLKNVGIQFFNEIGEGGDAMNPKYRNLLKLDESKLKAAMETDMSDVQKLFEFTYNSSDANFKILKHGSSLNHHNIVLTVNQAAQTASAVINGNTVLMDYNAYTTGGLAKGREGTPLEGYEILFTGTTTTTADINISQGVADILYNLIDKSTEKRYSKTGGSDKTLNEIEFELFNRDKTIKSAESKLSEKENRLKFLIDNEIDKYGRLEAAIAQANNIMMYFEMQMKMMGR